MKAIRFSSFGGPERLECLDIPAPSCDSQSAVVQIKSASVNPSDVKNVADTFTQTSLPRTPGRDFSGVAVEGPTVATGAPDVSSSTCHEFVKESIRDGSQHAEGLSRLTGNRTPGRSVLRPHQCEVARATHGRDSCHWSIDTMMFPNPIPPRGTLEGYSLALREAANEAAGRVLPPAGAHASVSRSIPLARRNLRHCWHCWYSWYCRLQAGAGPPGCGACCRHQVTGEMRDLGP